VAGSVTSSEYLPPRSVNRFSGWLDAVGASPGRGRSPLRSAGTASEVLSATVVALRYQSAFRASRAKLGKRTGSMRPSRPSSATVESSSKTIITTGVRAFAAALETSTSAPARTSSDTGDTSRKSARKTSGAGPRTLSSIGATRVRA
jgi:hypothetical protein